jgi:hypothetical protein
MCWSIYNGIKWSICVFFPEKELLKSELLDITEGDKLTLLKRKKKGDTFLKKNTIYYRDLH